MVNPDVDGCTTKTINHRKILQKRKKTLKTKIILKPKYKLNWARVLQYCSLQEGTIHPFGSSR